MSIAGKLTQIAENEQRVYEAGKAAERVERYEFWQEYQEGGNKTNYSAAFQNWEAKDFNPLYCHLRPENMYLMFNKAKLGRLTDHISLNTGNAVTMNHAFSESTIEKVGDIDCYRLGRDGLKNFNYVFRNSEKLTDIGTITMYQNITAINPFLGATALKEVRFAPCDTENNIGIGQNDFDFRDCPLSKESITSIINALSDTTSGLTLTLSKEAVDKAFLSGYIPLHPFKDGSKTDGGLSFTDNGNGSITVSGMTEGWPMYTFTDGLVLQKGVYELSREATGYCSAISVSIYDQNRQLVDIFPLEGLPVIITAEDGYILRLETDFMYEMEYDVTITPKLKFAEWDALISTKPNWTIALV